MQRKSSFFFCTSDIWKHDPKFIHNIIYNIELTTVDNSSSLIPAGTAVIRSLTNQEIAIVSSVRTVQWFFKYFLEYMVLLQKIGAMARNMFSITISKSLTCESERKLNPFPVILSNSNKVGDITYRKFNQSHAFCHLHTREPCVRDYYAMLRELRYRPS